MNRETVNQKLVNNEIIRDYFLGLSLKEKSIFRSLKDNITEKYNIVSNAELLVLFLCVLAFLIQFNNSLFSLNIIKEHKEVIIVGFCSFIATNVLYFSVVDEDCHIACLSSIGIMIFMIFSNLIFWEGVPSILFKDGKNTGLGDFFEYLSLFVMMLPVILNIGSLLYISLCGLLFREKDYDMNISQSDHKIIKEHINKEEMIIFLKNFKKYSDLPLEKMEEKRKKCQVKKQERLTVLSKEKKIEEYAESLYE